MAIKRYFASKDNTITNAFKSDLITRGTGSNMGAADILETFIIHGQTSASINAANAEQSRILIEFSMLYPFNIPLLTSPSFKTPKNEFSLLTIL